MNCESGFELPLLIKEAGTDNLTWPNVAGWGAEINHGPIGQHGDLTGIVKIRIVTEGETAIDDNVFIRVERVGVNHDELMVGCVVLLAVDFNGVLIPLDGELVDDFFEHYIAGRIAPEDEIGVGDVLLIDGIICFDTSMATKMPTPMGDGTVEF